MLTEIWKAGKERTLWVVGYFEFVASYRALIRLIRLIRWSVPSEPWKV
jgi:hypothetical protein